MRVLRLWFSLQVPVSRRAYLASGLLLAALKYALDCGVVYAASGKLWNPISYLVPSLVLRDEMLGPLPSWANLLLVIQALPFLWIGTSMSVRRAVDAGYPAELGFGFMAPGLNYLTIAVLAFPGSKLAVTSTRDDVGKGPFRAAAAAEQSPAKPARAVTDRVLAVLAGTVFGVAITALAVYGLDSYGAGLFFVAPAGIGILTTMLANRRTTLRRSTNLALCVVSVTTTGAALLLAGIEGLVCVTMATPLALVGSVTAGAIYHRVLSGRRRKKPPIAAAGIILLAVPLLIGAEAAVSAPTVREVVTAIEIDAPPDEVWPHVVGFSDLPPPPEWFFRLGIAYPMRARIDGEGVGAVRHCEFSTGPFVEPITRWEPPRRLSFDVDEQPPSMTEWSPYHQLNPPHLEGYMVSRGGEFRLVPIDGGRRTRLEGSTYYTLAIYPEAYWVVPAEMLLHAIHTRVLRHIERLSEPSPGAGSYRSAL